MENVKDLLDEASRFISFDDFVRKFKVKTSYLEYYKVVSTLTRYKKKLCSPVNGNDQTKDATQTVLSHTRFCKKANFATDKPPNDFVNAKSHAREKPMLAGYPFPFQAGGYFMLIFFFLVKASKQINQLKQI